MSKKKGRTKPREWTEWVEHVPQVFDERVDKVVSNSLYTVVVRRQKDQRGEGPDIIWLSIRRNDKSTVRDWRHLQRIKNELVGESYEGMEMYPAEDRLVDGANQYHLWVIDDPDFRWPWGYNKRVVATPEEAEAIGAKQRPFED